MALKKSQLYSSLWQSCDELRGGMDASQYKDYVLTLLFMKYVSDKYAGQPDALIVVPDGGGFADMVKLKGDKEIGDRINTIIGRLAEANDLKGVIDEADFNDESKLGAGKEMQDRLSKLVAIFESLDLSANRAEGDDLLGDAYEYLMRHFATESGKSKGQFYTPAEVSRVMAKVIGIGPDTRPDQTIYDPTCGSGSLLLKVADEAPRGITIYGQEMDNATWALARMNMFLHGHPTADLWRSNTLADPYFRNRNGGLRTFDFAVANPPFSAKAWSNGLDAHLNGGIPNGDINALGGWWEHFPSLRKALFKRNRKGYGKMRVDSRQVKATILGHEDFEAYRQRVADTFGAWRKRHKRRLSGLDADSHPREIIDILSEDLLARFADVPLLSRYDVYQRLMDYWDETMQDDLYLVAAVGWVEAARPRSIIEDRERNIRETPDLTVQRRKYKMDLIPPPLIVARWLTAEQAHIETLQAARQAAARELDEFVEEHSSTAESEGGPLADATNDKGKVTRTCVKARLRAVDEEDGPDGDDERDVLTRCLALIDAESRAGSVVREAQTALDRKVLDRYATLTETRIKTLVVEDKWLAGIRAAIEDEVDGLTQRLSARVQELGSALRAAVAGPGARGEGVQHQGGGASEADGGVAVGVSQGFDFEGPAAGRGTLPGLAQLAIDEWVDVTLGDAADIESGATPSTLVPDFWDGDVAWCTPTDITRTQGKYLSRTERGITESGLASCTARLLPSGTLLLCSRATIGEVRIAAIDICTNQGFKSLARLRLRPTRHVMPFLGARASCPLEQRWASGPLRAGSPRSQGGLA